MNIRTLGIAVAAFAACIPAVSHASPEKVSAEACAKAFAASIAAPGVAPSAYKLTFDTNVASGPLVYFYPADFSFDLQLKDPKTGLATARARCSANSHGTVTALSVLPTGAGRSSLEASL